MKQKQYGISMWGLLAIALVAGFFLLLIIKLLPVYMADMKVSSALTGLARQPDAADMTNEGIRESLNKRFIIDDIDEKIDLRSTLSIKRRGRTKIVEISYESVTPIFGNVSVLIDFDHSVEMGVAGGR